MGPLHRTMTVLNYLYVFVGIYWLIGAIGHTSMISNDDLRYNEGPIIVCYVISLMILATFFFGRAVLLMENNNMKELRCFAGLVLFGLLLQFFADYTMEKDSLDRLVALFKAAADVPASCPAKLNFQSLFGSSYQSMGKSCSSGDIIVILFSRPLFALLLVFLALAVIANTVQLLLIMFALIVAERVSDENVRSQTV